MTIAELRSALAQHGIVTTNLKKGELVERLHKIINTGAKSSASSHKQEQSVKRSPTSNPMPSPTSSPSRKKQKDSSTEKYEI